MRPWAEGLGQQTCEAEDIGTTTTQHQKTAERLRGHSRCYATLAQFFAIWAELDAATRQLFSIPALPSTAAVPAQTELNA